MKTILIPTKLDKVAAGILSQQGYNVIQDSETPIADLCKKNPAAEALIVRSEKVTPELIDLLPNLKAVVRAGAGYNTIDIKYARQKGIDVMNTPGANSNAVAEEVFAMLLAASRFLVPADIDTRAGGWSKKKFMGHEITGKTIGIVGLGNVGQWVARHAKGFDMKILAYDPIVSPKKAQEVGATLCTMQELFEQSDYITLHIPENNETRGSINAKLFALVKPGCIIVNCARAGIVNEDDLRAAKAEKGLLYCNDVYPADEAGPKSIADVADIMLPHLGANTVEANRAAAKSAAEELIGYFEQGITRFVVNKDVPDGLNPRYQQLAFKLTYLSRALSGSNAITAIRCSFYGELKPFSKWFIAPICAALSDNSDLHDTFQEAKAMLEAKGIELEIREPDDSRNYGNSMTIDLENGDSKVSLRGTLTENQLTISRIGNYDQIYAPLKGNMLFVEYVDRPGVLAKITSAIADAQINIDDLHTPHDSIGKRTMAILLTNQLVPAVLVDKIQDAVNAFCSMAVSIPA